MKNPPELRRIQSRLFARQEVGLCAALSSPFPGWLMVTGGVTVLFICGAVLLQCPVTALERTRRVRRLGCVHAPRCLCVVLGGDWTVTMIAHVTLFARTRAVARCLSGVVRVPGGSHYQCKQEGAVERNSSALVAETVHFT